MGELQGSLAKGPGVIRKQLVQADAFDIYLPNLSASRREAISHGREVSGVGGHILTTESFQESGLQGTRLLVPSLDQPLYSFHSPSLYFSLCFFFFFFFLAALLSFDACLALLPVSFSESELSESDDFLSIRFFFFSFFF